jgi:uncharacterized OsmC-like protein
MAMQQKTVGTKVNGVEVKGLVETINAVKQAPKLASFKFRLNNTWVTGGLNRSTIKSFYGTQQEHHHPEPFVLNAGEPPVLLGDDTAPNPVEYLLHALVACVTTSIVYHAAARGIHLKEIESRVEGDIDLQGFLDLDESVRRGFNKIQIKFRIKADVPDEQLEEVMRLGPTYSPVFDSITRGVNVEVGLEK